MDVDVGGRLAMYATLALVFVTGPLAVGHTRTNLYVTVALAASAFISGFLTIWLDGGPVWVIVFVTGCLFFTYLAVLTSREILFQDRPVDTEVLWGAVNVYLLIGLSFAYLYSLMSAWDSDLFVGKFMEAPLRDQMHGFICFSFATLTTLGFGDITPNDPFVATITVIEAVIGQLYLAILIARLVGLYIAQRR